MKNIRKNLFIFIVFFILKFNVFAGWYDERERGWYWHEEKTQIKKDKIQTPENARAMVEKLKQDLEDARHMWMAFPSPENATKYRMLEKQMWEKSKKSIEAWKVAGLLNPQLDDNLQNPGSVWGVKLARKNIEEQTKHLLEDFSKEVALIAFLKEGDLNSSEFKIVFDRFTKINKFESEIVFLGRKNLNKKLYKLQKKLNIQVFPSVFLVHKTEPIYLEISRGFMPGSDFETRVLLAAQYLKTKKDEAQ